MKYVAETVSGVIIYIPSFTKISSAIQKLINGGAQTACFYFFPNKESRLTKSSNPYPAEFWGLPSGELPASSSDDKGARVGARTSRGEEGCNIPVDKSMLITVSCSGPYLFLITGYRLSHAHPFIWSADRNGAAVIDKTLLFPTQTLLVVYV
jgi:hypothetical protein